MKLKEREAELNRYLEGRMKVFLTSKICNSQTMEGFVLELEGEQVQPIVYEEKIWDDLTDEELAEHLYQIRMEASIPEIPKTLFNRENILSRVRPMLMEGKLASELKSKGMLTETRDGFALLYFVPLPEFSEDEASGFAITRLNEDSLSKYQISQEELRKKAFDHLERDIRIEEFSGNVRKIYSARWGYGSVAILSERTQKRLHELYGERCCLLPCSMDFTIVLPENVLENPELLSTLAESFYLSIKDVRERLCKTPYLLERGKITAL